jgi:hypothetical protein
VSERYVGKAHGGPYDGESIWSRIPHYRVCLPGQKPVIYEHDGKGWIATGLKTAPGLVFYK